MAFLYYLVSAMHLGAAGLIAYSPELVATHLGIPANLDTSIFFAFLAFAFSISSSFFCLAAMGNHGTGAGKFALQGTFLGLLLGGLSLRSFLADPAMITVLPAHWEWYAGVIGFHLVAALAGSLGGGGGKKANVNKDD